MTWLFLLCVYLALHLILQLLLARRVSALTTERGVFLWHFVSFVAVAIVFIAVGVWQSSFDWSVLVLVMAVHGIYSLSLLELWALADGSYSLSILNEVESGHPRPEVLEALGGSKREARLTTLERLRLVRHVGIGYQLTGFGSASAALLHALRWSANLTDVG